MKRLQHSGESPGAWLAAEWGTNEAERYLGVRLSPTGQMDSEEKYRIEQVQSISSEISKSMLGFEISGEVNELQKELNKISIILFVVSSFSPYHLTLYFFLCDKPSKFSDTDEKL